MTLLALLIISAKQWDSDYPISTADVCAQNWSRDKDPVFEAKRVNETERRVLNMLDYCTVVGRTEFARYYLTAPFTFEGHRRGGCHAASGGAGPAGAAVHTTTNVVALRLATLVVPPSVSCSAIRSGCRKAAIVQFCPPSARDTHRFALETARNHV